MGALLAELLHGGLERYGHVIAFHVAFVKSLHKFRGAAVVDIPEGEKEGGCAGAKEAALEAEELVTGGDNVHPGGTAAQGHVAGGQSHLIEIVEVKVTITEANAGEHGVVLTVGAVGGDVQQRALRPLFSEGVRSGLAAEEEFCFR
jgi:hypothetical protein